MSDVFTGRVCVLGLGYIGLPTAAVLATRGIHVVGVDVNPQIVAAVNRGEVPFVEPDLAVTVAGAVNMGRLSATSEVPESDAYIIAVPTPFAQGHRADLSYVRAATENIAPQLRGGETIILESTSPPGTTVQIAEWIAELRPDLTVAREASEHPDIHLAHCPERVLPGRIMVEMLTNDRIVGGITQECAERAAAIYRVFCQGDIALTTASTAEMAKLVENSYRDVNIAFANELGLICDRLHLDVWEVIALANRHPRVNILSPGPGVGGHCIAVDPWFIVGAAPDEARLIGMARRINDERPRYVAEQILGRARRFRDPTVALLGLAYKANVDDLRESPALDIAAEVAGALTEGTVLVSEPHVRELPAVLSERPNVSLVPTAEAISRADIVALLVDHTSFRSIGRTALHGRIVFDTRGLWR
ncbi:MAG: UDP-N-acetyl-D-mannosamine dehydrogenase [Austwickia sp.]|jgi:UDP-N-acetyl-D-mannosaminuronic acid dehydrogenase|nr:UDP-N-acetyl-D-mannosamine dehydrogenase [Austwickia sp.]